MTPVSINSEDQSSSSSTPKSSPSTPKSSSANSQQQHQQQQQQQQKNLAVPQDVVSDSEMQPPAANLRRGPWSPDEDRKLMESINVHGASNWVRISQDIGTRTPKQCRERYHQNLKPSLNRTPITPEEGHLIEQLVGKYGKRWAEIARHLNGRSDNAIKNWWNGGANRRRRASSQAILQETSHRNPEFQPLSTSSFYQQQQQQQQHHQHIPFGNSSPSFNTSIFQGADQIPPQQHQILPPPHHQQQQPLIMLSGNSHMPPPQSRSSSINQELYQQQQQQLGIRRFLEEQHIPMRRHSAQTILTSTAGSSSPFSASPLSRGPSSRNSSISFDWNNNMTSYGDYSELSNNNSRKSSTAHDLFTNSQHHKRQSSLASTNHLSGSIAGHRNSLTAVSLTPYNTTQYPNPSTTASYDNQKPVFKPGFSFSETNDNYAPKATSQQSVPPVSIPCNHNNKQPNSISSQSTILPDSNSNTEKSFKAARVQASDHHNGAGTGAGAGNVMDISNLLS